MSEEDDSSELLHRKLYWTSGLDAFDIIPSKRLIPDTDSKWDEFKRRTNDSEQDEKIFLI